MPAVIPNVNEMLCRLIATPSVSSSSVGLDTSNLAVCELLAEWLTPLGFAVELLPVPDAPGKVNLLAQLGSGVGGLILAGHTDTVPADPKRWRTDPFAAEIRDDRLYGLGSADMKSFLGLAIEATRRLGEVEFTAPLIILATADEETSMSGARALLAAGRPRARYAVIGEPTGMRPVNLHKGIFMEAIEVVGRAGHSSDPTLGNNALEGMQRVMTALLAWRDELNRNFHDQRFAVPGPTLNLGAIRGGDSANRICPRCELELDLRLTPGMTVASVRADLRSRATAALANSGLELHFRELFAGVDPLETPADSTLLAALMKLSGHDAETVGFGTEGPFLQALGADTVIWGPGDIDQAHQPDEFIALAGIEPALAVLGQLIERFCIAGPGGQ